MGKKPASQSIPVDFSADQEYLISGLTADVTTLECVYDLIDNSIDAARNDLFTSGTASVDDYGLPASYSKYKVCLRFAPDSFGIEDNCSGMNPIEMSKTSFRIGSKSAHQFGIGHFGVGLKRSILKLGMSTAIRSDNGKEHITLHFTVQQLREFQEKPIFAQVEKSSGTKLFSLKITDLRSEIRHDFKSPLWISEMKASLSQRYGRFIEKGLQLFIGTEPVTPFTRTIQQGVDAFPPYKKRISLAGDVTFYLEAGLHPKYDPSPGAGQLGKNKKLSGEYGYAEVCTACKDCTACGHCAKKGQDTCPSTQLNTSRSDTE